MGCKNCGRCKKLKSLFEFSRRGNGYQSWCRDCYKDYDKKRYQKPKEKRRLLHKNREIRQRNRDFIKDFLSKHPCVDCNETDPIVLEFDHVVGTKEFAIADGVKKMYSLKRIKKEISKCEVRCANCHRRITHQRRQSGV